MLSDLDYLREAYRLAAEHSEDPSTWNGALLVSHGGEVLSWGVNRFPPGVELLPERLERPLKYGFIEHAERDCLYRALRSGVRTQGSTLYVCWYACDSCARAIALSGVSRVVGHSLPVHSSRHDWKASVELGDVILKEAGVKAYRVPGRVGVRIRFAGEEIEV